MFSTNNSHQHLDSWSVIFFLPCWLLLLCRFSSQYWYSRHPLIFVSYSCLFFFSDKYPFFLQNATLPFCGNAVNDSILVSCPLSDWGWIVWSRLVQSKFFFHQDFWVLREVTRNYRNWVLIVVSQGNHRNYVKTSPKMPWFLLSRPDYPDFPWFLRPPCTFIRFLSNKVGCFFFVLFCFACNQMTGYRNW